MAAKVVAFINFKGGVGKTSNVVNLGACLAKLHDKKVLLVDLDAQCNTTFWLSRREMMREITEKPKRTVYQLFNDAFSHARAAEFDPEKAILKGVPRTDAGFSLLPNLDLLPASVELIEVEDRLYGRLEQPYFTLLQRGLKEVAKDYDYILLDCPPNVFSISKNALFFADYYMIPYIPDYLSLSGFRLFCRIVKRFQEETVGQRRSKLGPRICGVIINRYKQVGGVFQKALMELKLELEDLKKGQFINPAAMILEPPIRDCVKLAECSNLHLPVILHSEYAISSQDYASLSTQFIQMLEQDI